MSLAAHTSARTEALVIRDRAVVGFVSGLLFMPSVLFALALRPIPAVVVIAGCLGAYLLVVAPKSAREPDSLTAPVKTSRLLACIAFALMLLLLGGETHLFYPTADWQIRDAVLADLVQHGFPVVYRVGESSDLLRAPLGMYLVPAFVGRILGLAAAHDALWAQNGLMLGAILYLLAGLGSGWRHVVILVLFAGVSIAGLLLRLRINEADGPFWLQWGLDAWHPRYQYSGSIVQFFWVPNHALPGWWLATLILLQRRLCVDVATLGVSVAGMLIWSPLAIVPAVPWLLWCTMRAWRPVLSSPRTWLGLFASAGFLPILAYLLSASSSIAHRSPVTGSDFVFWYELFIIVQLPVLAYLAVLWRDIPQSCRDLVVVNGLLLLTLPFFRFGSNNDLVMRGSIASLVIVAFVFGTVVIQLTDQRRRSGAVGWALIVCAAPSAVVEIGRAISTPSYAISDCSLMQASLATGDKGAPANYVAPVASVPAWLIDTRSLPAIAPVKQTCWPDLARPRYFGLMYKTVSKP